MNITYYGHSCFLIDLNGTKLLFDPFITPNPIAGNVDVNSIEADFILISHGHEDHVADVESIAKKHYESKGLSLTLLNINESITK